MKGGAECGVNQEGGERIMDTKQLLDWSEKISRVAADCLNRDGSEEKAALRKCIKDWIDKIEPYYDLVTKSPTFFDYQFYYMESRNWEWCGDDEWSDPQTGIQYLTEDALKLQFNRDRLDKKPHPGVSEMEAIRC